MTKEQKYFLKKYIQYQKKINKIYNSLYTSQSKFSKNYTSFLSNIRKTLNPVFNKIKSNDQFSYKIEKDNIIKIFKSIPNTSPDLILEITFLNLSPTIFNLDNTKSIGLHLNYYNSSKDFKWELEKSIFLGEISKFILKNESKVLNKIDQLYKAKLKVITPIIKKITNLNELFTQYTNFNKNFLHTYILKDLKTGISLSLKSFNSSIIHPYNLTIDSINYKNIIKIKLLESNELLITNIGDSSNTEQTHIINLNDIQENIKTRIISSKLIPYITSPQVYVELRSFLSNKKH